MKTRIIYFVSEGKQVPAVEPVCICGNTDWQVIACDEIGSAGIHLVCTTCKLRYDVPSLVVKQK